MKNIESEIRRTTFFTTAILLSMTIQLLAQSSYPVFEDRAVEFYVEQIANSLASD